jgi:ABC-type phosphate transport system substrate-binding protein
MIEAAVAPQFKNAEGKADAKAAKAAHLAIPGAQFSEDDNVLVKGVEGDKYAIGYFGYAYYAEEAGKLKAVNINDVEPNQANVDAGKYPLARPLFIYSDAKIMQSKPQVAAFIAFYLQNLDANVKDVGYFPAPKKAIYEAWGAWLSAVGGVEVNPDVVSGDIITAGSSTVFPLSERMAELFQQEGTPATSPLTPSAPALASNASARPAKPTSPTPPAPSRKKKPRTARPLAATRSNSALAPMPWR